MSYEYQVNAHLSNEDADEFIKENPYNFNEEEINVTKDFKKHVKSNFLMIVGFDKDYTKILAEDVQWITFESILQEANKAITYYHL